MQSWLTLYTDKVSWNLEGPSFLYLLSAKIKCVPLCPEERTISEKGEVVDTRENLWVEIKTDWKVCDSETR